MKNLFTIGALFILLLLSGGYRVFIFLFEKSAQKSLQMQIDADAYKPENLIELSVALDLPYMSNWNDWEPVKGIITIAGVPYQYVERKLMDGKMFYRCLPNSQMQLAVSARDRFLQYSFDFLQGNTKDMPVPMGVTIKPPCWDYLANAVNIFTPLPISTEKNHRYPFPETALAQLTIPVPTPPPNALLHCI